VSQCALRCQNVTEHATMCMGKASHQLPHLSKWEASTQQHVIC
jgi:hypothetical protein